MHSIGSVQPLPGLVPNITTIYFVEFVEKVLRKAPDQQKSPVNGQASL